MFACVVAQRVPQLVHHVLERRFVDVPVPPHRIEQSVLGHQLAGVPRQFAQHLEGARGHVDGVAVAVQLCLRLVDAERPELQSQRLYLFHGADCASAAPRHSAARRVDDRTGTEAGPLQDDTRAAGAETSSPWCSTLIPSIHPRAATYCGCIAIRGEGMDFATAAELLDWLASHAAQECDGGPGRHPNRKDKP
jgi:hypothetical protein